MTARIPSFVLIPQDSANFKAERALSSDSVGQRFVHERHYRGADQEERLRQ